MKDRPSEFREEYERATREIAQVRPAEQVVAEALATIALLHEERATARRNLEVAMVALRVIARMDWRGNRPAEQVVAEATLKTIEEFS